MNEDANLLAVMYLAFQQVQSMKDKVDPEVFELLNTAGHEAISSAHHFLDACEKALDSFVGQQETDEIDLTSDHADHKSDDNVVNLNTREG